MNKITSWFYRFRPVRLAWFRLKHRLNQSFNNREKIQEALDINRFARIPTGAFSIDHTIHISQSNSTIIGSSWGETIINGNQFKEML